MAQTLLALKIALILLCSMEKQNDAVWLLYFAKKKVNISPLFQPEIVLEWCSNKTEQHMGEPTGYCDFGTLA